MCRAGIYHLLPSSVAHLDRFVALLDQDLYGQTAFFCVREMNRVLLPRFEPFRLSAYLHMHSWWLPVNRHGWLLNSKHACSLESANVSPAEELASFIAQRRSSWSQEGKVHEQR